MKKYFLTTALSVLTFTLTGCYTIMWNPSENNFPTEENSNYENGFYAIEYYGDYSDFYGSPWWYNITPPGYIYNNDQIINDGTVIRNLGGRGERTRVDWNILTTNPATKNSSTQTRDLSRSNVNTSTNSNTSSNTSTRSESNRSSQSSTNSRNDNGSRNTDNGRGR